MALWILSAVNHQRIFGFDLNSDLLQPQAARQRVRSQTLLVVFIGGTSEPIAAVVRVIRLLIS